MVFQSKGIHSDGRIAGSAAGGGTLEHPIAGGVIQVPLFVAGCHRIIPAHQPILPIEREGLRIQAAAAFGGAAGHIAVRVVAGGIDGPRLAAAGRTPSPLRWSARGVVAFLPIPVYNLIVARLLHFIETLLLCQTYKELLWLSF